MTNTIQAVAIVGAGTMGHGIAQSAALAGMHVCLTDVDSAALARALELVKKNLDGGIERGKVTTAERDGTLSRLTTASDLASAVAQADLCIEAVVENLQVKQEIFSQLEEHAPATAILATNTSALSIGEIAARLRQPERAIGLHFFNPVHIMKLVEVVVHERTAEEVKATAMAFVEAISKVPIVVQDSPGFASSRLGIALGMEAIRMVEQGVASPEDIDTAMELGYKHPMGPLKLTDIVGLDVRLAIAENLHEKLGGTQFEPPALLRKKVAAGELGRKTGKGFYDWKE